MRYKKTTCKQKFWSSCLLTLLLLALLPQVAFATEPTQGAGQAATEQLPEALRTPPKKVPDSEKPPVIQSTPTETPQPAAPQAALPDNAPPPPAPVLPETPGDKAKTVAASAADKQNNRHKQMVPLVTLTVIGVGLGFIVSKRRQNHQS